MYVTKTFYINSNRDKPYLCVEINSNQDSIDAKFLKHDSGACFNIHIPGLRKIRNSSDWNFIYINEENGDHYEYFVFTAGFDFIDRIIIVDIVNKTFSVSMIDGVANISHVIFNIMDINPTIVNLHVVYCDDKLDIFDLYVDNYIKDLVDIFDFDPDKYLIDLEEVRNYPKTSVTYFDINGSTHTVDRINDGFKSPCNKDLDHNKNRKEVSTMPTKKVETKVTAATEANTEPTKKEEPTPRQIISEYAEAYDNMTKDAIRGNDVFGLLSPEHRLSIAAHLDQIVEILERYIGK